MRRTDRQIRDNIDLESILRSARICHLSMVDDGRPYVVPLNFGYEDGALYFHSAPEGRKIDVLGRNPDVCFSIIAEHELVTNERACSWTARFRSVTGTGKASILTDRQEKEKGLTILMSQYSNCEFDFSKENLDRVVVIKVRVEGMTGKSST
ncbi:MAG: pyridoxamine 5'-phosphate oxidase family protein [bacterium]|nr:MAG: pyridoxamine 5'-phosphate oxidase family protein [bacterium]